jgi:hypothetical protein
MTQDEIIEMAKRVGFPIQHPEWRKATEEFAALVEEQAIAKEREAFAKIQHESLLQAMRIEREACAKVADGFIGGDVIAERIRARTGEQK